MVFARRTTGASGPDPMKAIMSKSAAQRPTTPHVFISSTIEDLEPYRSAAREAVIAAGMFPVLCDNFPANGADPPLKVCLDRVSRTDVLIVLVAHRYGWRPKDQSKKNKPRKSITWLECQQAADDEREVLGFLIGQKGEWPAEQKEEYRFTKAGVERQLTPELSADITEALDGLDAFKSWLGGRGIRKTVETAKDLQVEIGLALNDWRLRHPEIGAPAVAPGEVVTPDKYLRELLETTSFINIRGLAVRTGNAHRFPIEDLYIALKSRMGVRDPEEASKGKPRGKKSGQADEKSAMHLEGMMRESGEVPLQAALSERRLVVIGDPGAGKTTFLRRVAAALCVTELGTVPQAAQARLGISDKTFPIFLRCATLANHIAAHRGKPDAPAEAASPAWLAHCLAATSRENGTGLDQAFFQRQLEAGRCTVLLDGLDEAADRVQRDALSLLAENISRVFDGCRFVVTSRPPAYTGNTVLPQFVHVEIAPLSDDAVDTFLSHWCRKLYDGDTPQAREHCRELLESLHARPEIRRVARNPVMLTALAVVHWNERRMPEQRAELYDSVITWLSRSREDRPGREKPERTVMLLQELALAMQNHPDGRQAQVSNRWAAEQLAPHFGAGLPMSESVATAEEFLSAEELDSGIVVAVRKNIEFSHVLFQEFLASRAIANRPESEQWAILSGSVQNLYLAEWREVILLLAVGLHKQGEAKVDGFVSRVLDTVTASSDLAAEANCAGLLAAVFHDLKSVGYQPHEPRYDALLGKLSKEADFVQPVLDELRDARELLAKGDIETARQRFRKIISALPEDSELLNSEVGFVFDFNLDDVPQKAQWKAHSAQIEWRRRIWTVLGHHDIELPKPAANTHIHWENAEVSDSHSIPDAAAQVRAQVTEMTSEAKGEALEQATLQLLKMLFEIDDANQERILEELSQQLRGSQLGFDVKLTYYDRRAGRDIRSFVECKSQESAITVDIVAGKIAELDAMQSKPDHWILIAPRAESANTLKTVLDDWRDRERYSFEIHIWTRGTGVDQLFGLVPVLFDLWFEGRHIDGDHPSKWSNDTQIGIINHWRRKLEPPLRLPPGWKDYVRLPRHWKTFSDESEDILAKLRENHVEPRAIDETGAPIPGTLGETVATWLESQKRTMVLLGDFGDGKTVATYLLTSHLLQRFRLNPKACWLPLRCSLRDFSRPNIAGGREFLRRRIEEFGADIGGWLHLIEEHSVFVILDGLDEMTTSLDPKSVKNAIDRLRDCCTHEFQNNKILLTCRTPFFHMLPEREHLLSLLGDPQVLTLCNLDRATVTERLALEATTPERRVRLESLRMMHDPIGLATKPLFLQMVSETLWDPEADCTSAIALYESYIKKSLKRKSELLDPVIARVGREEQVNRLMTILEEVAMAIHRSQREFTCLKRIADKATNAKYAQMLWDRANSDESLEDDATARVGVRSLLRRIHSGEETHSDDDWPVDFCHRSLREYFVARYIVSVIRENASKAMKILASTDLNNEICQFVALLIRRDNNSSAYHPALRSMAEHSRLSTRATSLTDNDRTRLGRNAVNVLFKSEGELREHDWDAMTLDGVNLAGADLSRKSFCGTSLKNAILDNANFSDANFSNVDLTGVRLEETSEVRSLSVPGGADHFIASYNDGRVRKWSLAMNHESSSHVTYAIGDGAAAHFEISSHPGFDLCLHYNNRLVFADYIAGSHERVAEFRTRPEIQRIIIKKDLVLVVESDKSGQYCVSMFKLDSEVLTNLVCHSLGASSICDCYRDKVIVSADPKRGIVLDRVGSDVEATICPSMVPTSLAVCDLGGDQFLVACGDHQGNLKVLKCCLTANEVTWEEITAFRAHEGAVTAMAFLEDQSLLSGGIDRKIVRSDLRPEKENRVMQVYQLQLRCEGMNVNGLKSERERKILTGLGAQPK